MKLLFCTLLTKKKWISVQNDRNARFGENALTEFNNNYKIKIHN